MNKLQTIGFIGVGDLAEYTITGLRRGGYQGRILLSPRNQHMSQKLAKDWQCEVMESNQTVVDNVSLIILSTRPANYQQALAELTLNAGHLLVSVVAGVSINELQAVTGEPIDVVRAMPVNCAKAGASPTLVYPSNPLVNDLFDYCGNSIVASNEDAFAQGSVLACVYTWYFALFGELTKACTNQSLSKEQANQLVLGMAKGAASLALRDDQADSADIAEAIATEGTFSKLGLDILKQEDAFEPWRKACEALQKRM